MIDFPNSPTQGQQFTAAGVTWIWDGVKWTPAGASSAAVQAMNDNRIINGDMRVDQRWNGSSQTGANTYTVDRWLIQLSQAGKGSWGRSSGATATFPYYWGLTSSSAYASVAADYFFVTQAIEADMVSDFAWGTAQAQPVTLSFWVLSNQIGTFSGAIRNGTTPARSYPFTFVVSSANVWTRIVITIPGDAAGTWVLSGNGTGLYLRFDLGTGSTYRGPANAWANGDFMGATGSVSVVAVNGGTFALTGVKLEIGSVATPYNRQSLAKSLMDCQRYYQNTYGAGLAVGTATNSPYEFIIGVAVPANAYYNQAQMFFVPMRVAPNITFYSVAGVSGAVTTGGSSLTAIAADIYSTGFGALQNTSSTTWAVGGNVKAHWTASAEL